MSLVPITDLLERQVGLEAATLGASIVPAAVADHMRELGIASVDDYTERLAGRPDLLQALTERLVVPESWFFRGGELFSFLAGHIANAVALHSGHGCYRVLSLPCSTGEEPYSLAIALLEAGIPSDSWRIEGIDLSARAIALARRGVFREFSFRQTPSPHPSPLSPRGRGEGVRGAIKDRYFAPVEGGWQINDTLRGSVTFGVGNLLEANVWNVSRSRYDLVFCRNLLIYFSAAARLRALTELERLLLPGGLLVVGHAEPQILAGRPFRRFGPDGSFLFRHESGPTVSQAFVQAKPGGQERLPHKSLPSVRPTSIPAAAPQSKRVGQECSPQAVPPLAAVRQLADVGRLEEAVLRCQAHLDTNGPSADAYCLLGVILQARGVADQAEDAFRKAIYLDPEHREALTHAMLLLSRRGETSRAAALRARLERLPAGGDS